MPGEGKKHQFMKSKEYGPFEFFATKTFFKGKQGKKGKKGEKILVIYIRKLKCGFLIKFLNVIILFLI